MARGYEAPPSGDSVDPIIYAMGQSDQRLDRLEVPTGTAIASLVEQVRSALADIDAQVAAAIAANSYTKAQTDAKVATPGAISPTTVNASGNVDSGGRVYSDGAVVSPGSRATVVSVGYVAQWIDSDGVMGYVPSTRASKRDLVEMDARAIYAVKPYWGHYLDDPEGELPKSFVIAEEVLAAGFGPDVVPLDDDGALFTVNYSQLVPGLLAAVHDLDARLRRLEE